MPHDANRTEDAVLAVLGGASVEAAARAASTTPARLSEAVQRYRAAGRAALDAHPSGWHQVNIRFSDYPTAHRAFNTHLTPALRTGPVDGEAAAATAAPARFSSRPVVLQHHHASGMS